MMAGLNKGEEYIHQLSKQSTENARRRAEYLDAPNPYPAPPTSERVSPVRGAKNAGEEYVQQLARNSAENARRRSEAFAEARRQAERKSAGDVPAPVRKPAPPNVRRDSERERALAELDKLEKEAEELEQLLERRQKAIQEETSEEEDEIDIDSIEVEDLTPQQITENLEALEARLASTKRPAANLLDDQIAEIEAKLAARQKAAEDPHIAAYDEMRDKLDRALGHDDDEEIVTRFVEEEPQLDDEELDEPSPQLSEVDQLRRGMIELRLENERFAKATRELQEKHEQMVQIILENYMPGL